MITEDQSEVIAFLSDPAAYGLEGEMVERVETHGAIVFLVGSRAYKLKRAVYFEYMDFSSREHRRKACEAEIRINSRTAPAIYRRVVPIARRPDGRLCLGGEGEIVDWLVEMARFDQDTMFDRMALRGDLTEPLVAALAEEIADFHEAAERRPRDGGAKAMAAVLEGNAHQLASFTDSVFDASEVHQLIEQSGAALDDHRARLEERRREGFVRHCHGDLHLHNIFLFEGQPTLFDAIEFNQSLANIDVLYDLAFLLMDLLQRGLPGHANQVLNRYLWRTDDLEGLELWPLFLSCRAAIRAHTGAAAAEAQADTGRATALREEARGYAKMALALLRPAPPRLVAISGLSGTGKTSLALGLAPDLGAPPGAVVLRSDVIRKRAMGATPSQRLGPEAYSEQISARVYATLCQDSIRVLRAGQAAVADAVFARPAERHAIEKAASQIGVPFAGLWLEGPAEILAQRIGARTGDVSDATVAVMEQQRGYDLGEVRWTRVDAAGPPESVLGKAREVLLCGKRPV